MTGPLLALAVGVVAYLLGAIPFALIIPRTFWHVDPRTVGSGNLGATNVFRVLGPIAGLSVAILDVAKGSLAAGAAVYLSRYASAEWRDWLIILAALGAMSGHSYSPYIGFKGGKSVATAAGAILVATPAAWIACFFIWVAILVGTRMVSLGSIFVAIELPVLFVVLYPERPVMIAFAVVASSLVVWRHRGNVSRILNGTESRIGGSGSRRMGSPAEDA